MPVRQTKSPNLNAAGRRGWCLEYIDNATSAPKRTPSAQAAFNNEQAAKRIRTDDTPLNVWVIGFLAFTKGPYVNLGHVFFIKNLGGGKYDIRDTETRSGARAPYKNINELCAWFGAYAPKYTGYSFSCDGATIAEAYAAPTTPTRVSRAGTATVTVDALNVRDNYTTNGKIMATYKKGDTFNYDSFIKNEGITWLSYVSYSGHRRYVAQGKGVGNNYVKGGL